MALCKGRLLGISVAVAHGVFSGSLNIVVKVLISHYGFSYLTLLQCLTSSTTALLLDLLRRLGLVAVPPLDLGLARTFAAVTVLSTMQSTLTLWALRGLSLPMYVMFKRCLPLVTLLIGVVVLRSGLPSVGVILAVFITTSGAALAGAGDLTGEPVGYVTGVLAVLVHAAYLVLIQKTSTDSDYGPLTAQYAIAVTATPILIICSFASMDSINAWSFPGWKDPGMICTFIACILIGCAMNFTTLHCTYINSAVTTSFVGVVKSIATITVGMLAFNDVEPTSLFIAGVVVNTIGSIIYCIAKYIDTRRQINYEDLEKEAKREEDEEHSRGQQPPFALEEVPKEKAEDGASEWVLTADGNVHVERMEQTNSISSVAPPASGPLESTTDGPNKSSFRDAYLGVWRSVRGLKFLKKECLIENEELPSP